MKRNVLCVSVSFLILMFILSLAACGGGGSSSTSGGGGGGGGGGSLPRATINGTVKSGGVGVAGATVTLKDALNFVYFTTTTDASGNFSGTTGPEQDISSTFTATKAGFGVYTQSVTISQGRTYTFSAVI